MSTQPQPTARKCPRDGCPGRLVVRTNSRDNSVFLGCSEYPRCDYTEPLPQDQVMKAIGAPTLPGMERL
jgi:ssDNA-binding Zn-finger/Zn-ribbon topoisomerase 1